MFRSVVVFLISLSPMGRLSASDWDDWWGYHGISGSEFWGLYNPEWEICSKGRYQSPVDIDPKKLLYDPNLPLLHIDKHRISGNFANNGHGIIFSAANTTDVPVNITFIDSHNPGYVYRFEEIHLHWGSSEKQGSEHFVRGQSFPGEVQIFAYNSLLYRNFSQAASAPYGLLAISILWQIGDNPNSELSHLLSKVEHIRYKGSWQNVQQLSIRELLPDTDAYVTYAGSLTQPGCHETVQWIVLNKPIYISKQQLYALRKIRRGEKEFPGTLMENNYRALKPFGSHRIFRTNIDFSYVTKSERACPSMYKEFVYQAKEWSV
ncbi:carbonic anhydrase-related protein 10-like isoform X2 [Paramacrobiotus metropolitanus]|uniref:carbonic anhydrase-related protein 10-like isoform X2 n=1 Tax=Paramacrobiotus metropolitanus TaxID=2943436 RepID=UPI00244603C0|nr:carbonic anhydrase-related protein 10-like isoform X2 [Paramacrobiotus metropolitanus]